MRTTSHTLRHSALLILTLLAVACSGGEPPGPPTGASLFQRQNCNTCHKEDGRGGPLGPTLKRASEYWTRETLADYLADPARFVGKDARLNSLAQQFNMQMPPARLEREQLLMLADHVLAFGADR